MGEFIQSLMGYRMCENGPYVIYYCNEDQNKPVHLQSEQVLFSLSIYSTVAIELKREKTYLRTCVPSEDSDQPAHS